MNCLSQGVILPDGAGTNIVWLMCCCQPANRAGPQMWNTQGFWDRSCPCHPLKNVLRQASRGIWQAQVCCTDSTCFFLRDDETLDQIQRIPRGTHGPRREIRSCTRDCRAMQSMTGRNPWASHRTEVTDICSLKRQDACKKCILGQSRQCKPRGPTWNPQPKIIRTGGSGTAGTTVRKWHDK